MTRLKLILAGSAAMALCLPSFASDKPAAKPATSSAPANPAPTPEEEMAAAKKIHERITATSKDKTEAEMKGYTNTITGTKVTYAMLPIPGGEFTMGSPDAEPERKADEGPQHKVKISPFWMGRCEVTWNEFELFMYPDEERKFKTEIATDPYVDKISDAVTRPTKPYVEMSFGMGKDGYPAISMTQYGAIKYCQWLSAKTGEFYRLPTEAEWEYACRAGTTTAYFFGDDPKQLGDYAWYAENSDFKYQKVGKKKPNPWGLHDIIGNVAEWCLDAYDRDYYKQFADKAADNPWNKASKPYPHVVRGGGWDLIPQPDASTEVAQLRSAARVASDKSWKQQDPQLPKSIWYHTDAQFLGFRIVRPLKTPTLEEMYKYWNSGVEKE
jgi:formylglycine-generating enzyme required for sulfatase activity